MYPILVDRVNASGMLLDVGQGYSVSVPVETSGQGVHETGDNR